MYGRFCLHPCKSLERQNDFAPIATRFTQHIVIDLGAFMVFSHSTRVKPSPSSPCANETAQGSGQGLGERTRNGRRCGHSAYRAPLCIHSNAQDIDAGLVVETAPIVQPDGPVIAFQ